MLAERTITNAEVREAEEIIRKHKQQQDQYKVDKNKQETKLLLGRYFKGSTCGFADENGVDIFRVLGKGNSDGSVIVENWRYAHSGHYKINEISWMGIESIDNLEEIPRDEYVNEVNRFLGKLGLVKQ